MWERRPWSHKKRIPCGKFWEILDDPSTYYLTNFSPELHENEKMLAQRGARPLRPSRSASIWSDMNSAYFKRRLILWREICVAGWSACRVWISRMGPTFSNRLLTGRRQEDRENVRKIFPRYLISTLMHQFFSRMTSDKLLLGSKDIPILAKLNLVRNLDR